MMASRWLPLEHNPFGWRGDWPPGALLQTSCAKSTFQKCRRQLHFRAQRSRRERRARTGEPMRSQNFRGNVFVANLPPEISDEQLAEAFDAFGIVLRPTVAHDPAP